MKRHLSVVIFSAMTLLGVGTIVWAQEETPPVQTPATQSQMQQAPPQLLSPQQLNNLVAPIALYPDPLLSQILVASTYPLEIVEANQWLQRNQNLGGQELMDAAKQQPWDPSVQALVAVPDALAKLNQDISWTTDLGNAFLAQEADVMNAVQEMRARAQGNGNLASTPQQTVTTEAQGGQQVIVIQPADPQVIYVPSYDPVYVWGPPVYGYYPPLYYSGFGFGFGRGFNLSFFFDSWGGWGGWGWGPSWFGRSVFVNSSFFPRYGFRHGYGGGFGGRTIWAHDPGHRLGIPYGNRQVAARFQGPSMASRNSFQTGIGSRAAAGPYANRSAGRIGDQGSRMAPQPQSLQSRPQQRYQTPQRVQPSPQQRYQTPQRVQPSPQQRYQTPQRVQPSPQQRYQTPQRVQPSPQQRYQAPQRVQPSPQQRYQAPQRVQPSPQQRYQAPQRVQPSPQQRYQAPQRVQPSPQQRYQAPQRVQPSPQQRYQAPQRVQPSPQQRYQAPQQYRSAPQMSAPRFSSGGSFSGGRGSGSSNSRGGGGGGRRR